MLHYATIDSIVIFFSGTRPYTL